MEYDMVIEDLAEGDYFIGDANKIIGHACRVTEISSDSGLTWVEFESRPECIREDQTDGSGHVAFVSDGLVLKSIRPKAQEAPAEPPDAREQAWSDYCDQMECTASGRPFAEFEGDLHDAFDYGWQAAMDHNEQMLSRNIAKLSKKIMPKAEQVQSEFKVGDEVIGVGIADKLDITGKRGVVRLGPGEYAYNKDWIGVEFDEEIKAKGYATHGLERKISSRRGYWCPPSSLRHA
jgi:hypothetical protein